MFLAAQSIHCGSKPHHPRKHLGRKADVFPELADDASDSIRSRRPEREPSPGRCSPRSVSTCTTLRWQVVWAEMRDAISRSSRSKRASHVGISCNSEVRRLASDPKMSSRAMPRLVRSASGRPRNSRMPRIVKSIWMPPCEPIASTTTCASYAPVAKLPAPSISYGRQPRIIGWAHRN